MRFAVAAALAALLLPHPLWAQADGLDDESEILVTGQRDLESRLNEFVGALVPGMPPRPSGQIGRFETAVCPAALGLSASNRAAVEQRLRTVAAAAGIDVAPADCAVNSLLVVVDDKRAFINALRQRHRRYLGNLTPTEIRRLMRSPGPAAAWQQTAMVTARGTSTNGGGSSNQLDWINRTTEPPSRITAPARPVFEGAVLVVERRALAGLTATQLADYAAMRLYARTDPSRLTDQSAPTIVTVLDAPMGSEVPLTMTEWDLGVLRGLYASPNNLYSGAQRSEMVREIGHHLEQRAAEGE